MDYIKVYYQLTGNEEEAYKKARDICYEQTVEYPADLIKSDFINNNVIGKVTSFSMADDDLYHTEISYPVETSAFELTQFMNVIFGNISIKPGIFLEKMDLPHSLLKRFKGPRFGIDLREYIGIKEKRPLLSTPLKPMGLSAEDLADLAYKFAKGGIDIIKDDHGLTDQHYAPFEERVALCGKAVEKANNETGYNCIYAPNITAPYDLLEKRIEFALKHYAKAFLISPMITGFDTMRFIAENDDIGLPILSHPAFLGTFLVSDNNGISHFALLGQLNRLAGADAVIFPNFGGRFSFSREECKSIVQGANAPMEHIKKILPAPGGGMTMEKIPEMKEVYSNDVIYLIGAGLFRRSDDLVKNCEYFREMVS